MAESAQEPVIRIEGLRKSFGSHEVLKNIDFEILLHCFWINRNGKNPVFHFFIIIWMEMGIKTH